MGFQPIKGLSRPPVEGRGWIRTLNQTGNTTIRPDPYSQRLIKFAARAPGPLLDVGAAYGVATLPALAAGCSVVAVDSDARHLSIMWDCTPSADRARLQLVNGAVPDGVHFDLHAFGAILLCRVLAIFDGPVIERIVRLAAEWLMPGGTLCIVSETPWLGNIQMFHAEYERRKAAGELWPGQIHDVHALVPERADILPPMINLLDPDILMRLVTSAGLQVDEVGWIPRQDFPDEIQFDGRECAGVLASKRVLR